jgi:hypothetical protein
MANIVYQVANPTAADVTVNAKVAKARRVTKLTLDNTALDAYGFLAAGCAITSDVGSSLEQKLDQGFMFNMLQGDLQ